MMLSPLTASRTYLATLNSMTKTVFILIAYLTCCIWAWPVAPKYQRNYNDFLPMEPLEPELQSFNYNQWDVAQEPVSYDQYQADDFYQAPASEFEALSNLFDMYEDAPVWGQIVNQKPETELEELKAEERHREAEARQRAQQRQRQNDYNTYQYYDRQEKRDNVRKVQSPSLHKQQVAPSAVTSAPLAIVSSTPKAATATTHTKASSPVPASKALAVNGPSGQKEVPLLRPPNNKAKTMNIHEPDEPVINVAQRSAIADKPSAYDTLRKYLTLEDALKKEAEKRRVHKRTPVSNGNKQIVSDVDSLGGQLKSLKKTGI